MASLFSKLIDTNFRSPDVQEMTQNKTRPTRSEQFRYEKIEYRLMGSSNLWTGTMFIQIVYQRNH